VVRDRRRVSLNTKETAMANDGPIIVGVFDEVEAGDTAVEALRQAGFKEEQIYYSAQPHAGAGGFVSTLRAFFTTGSADDGSNVEHTLEGMGLSDDDADFYDTEYREGHKIIAVRTDNRYEEALNILREKGGHHFYNEQGGRISGTVDEDGPAPSGVIDSGANEEGSAGNTSATETNPATDPANEFEGAYASNPALRPNADSTYTTGTAAGATPAGGQIDTGATTSDKYRSESTEEQALDANTTDSVSDEPQDARITRDNPATVPSNEMGGAYVSNPALQPTENERREGETEEQRLNRLRNERQRDVPELDSDRGSF
jgi:hypothetical protein